MTDQTNGQPRSVAILGATSAVARAIALQCAKDGYDVVLAGRDQEEGEALAADVRVRTGAACSTVPFDALAFDTHEPLVQDCRDALGRLPDGLVLCFGYMTDQAETQTDAQAARHTIDANFTAAVSVLSRFANAFEERGSGFIGVLTSVAGDRGRMSNYTYGSAKAGLGVFLQGLRNRLHHAGVSVTTVKPGFMDTKMTYGMDLPGLLTASPERAGEAAWRAIQRGRNEVYVLWFWRYIMLIIRSIPEWLFKRMTM